VDNFSDHKPLLLIRVDGSATIGTGHAMRCRALAEAWCRFGRVHFLCAESTPALDVQLQSVGELSRLEFVERGSADDARQTLECAEALASDWIVADGYCFGSEWQRVVNCGQTRLLLLDDFGHADHYFADLVLNQNLHAAPDVYCSRENGTELLLGTRYVLLRSEFLEWRKSSREIPPVAKRVLITLGGSDPHNVTTRAVDSVGQLPELEISVVVGGSNPHQSAIEAAAARAKSPVQLLVDTSEMPALMASADMAVSAGGTTTWELMFMGLPTVAVTLADNQVDVVAALEKAGLGISAGLFSDVDFDERLLACVSELRKDAARRRAMGRRARELVDGMGCARVIAKMRSLDLRLRRVREDDGELLWHWANDPLTRSMSFNSDTIEWDSHLKWLHGKLTSPFCYLYVAEHRGNGPIGQVRFDVNGSRAVISVNVAPEQRGRGHGAAIIVAALRQLQKAVPVHSIDAFIKSENQMSAYAFMKAGFFDASAATDTAGGSRHFVYAYDANE
jgi:UDP-2,4-diacetamido-2,4,6-trideoxy-beta-L-altropyranose hydrolase